jgi:uncharacterized coiled-coil protein SlyX
MATADAVAVGRGRTRPMVPTRQLSYAAGMAARLEDVEIKVAYLERALDKLDEVVRTLSDEMDMIRREVARMREASDDHSELPPSEKPPHY